MTFSKSVHNNSIITKRDVYECLSCLSAPAGSTAVAFFPVFQKVLDNRTNFKLVKAWAAHAHLRCRQDLDASLE